MILEKLKEATRSQHEETESVVDVMNRAFDLNDYKTLIRNFSRFYAAYEPKLPVAELAAKGFDYETRRKLPSLQADARALGLVIDGPEYDQLPDVSSVAKAFGSLYVIEGSTLGGQVISRHLKQHLDLTPENGGAFFNSYGPEVGPRWKEFGAAIRTFAETGEHDDEIVSAAKATFESVMNVFRSEATAKSSNTN